MRAARNKLNYLSEPVEENASTGFYAREACRGHLNQQEKALIYKAFLLVYN